MISVRRYKDAFEQFARCFTWKHSHEIQHTKDERSGFTIQRAGFNIEGIQEAEKTRARCIGLRAKSSTFPKKSHAYGDFLICSCCSESQSQARGEWRVRRHVTRSGNETQEFNSNPRISIDHGDGRRRNALLGSFDVYFPDSNNAS